MAWPWGACWGSGLGPGRGVPVGEVALALGCLLGKVFGILFWKVWSLCGLANGSFEIHKKSHCCVERLESFGGFAGWQTAALKAHRKPLLWPGPGVPVGEVALALALGCLLGKWPCPVKEGVWNFGGVAAFAGWQTAALKASRKSLLWI